MFIHLFAIFCYGFLRELWGPAWAVCSYSRSPPAGGIPQVLNLTNDWMNNAVLSSTTLRLLWWTTGHCNSSRLGQSFSLSRQAVTALVARSGSANQRTDERQADVLFLKHASSIFRQSSNPVCGFSRMEQVRLCAVWPMAWLFHDPHTGLDDCLRMLQACFIKRMSDAKCAMDRCNHAMEFHDAATLLLWDWMTAVSRPRISFLGIGEFGKGWHTAHIMCKGRFNLCFTCSDIFFAILDGNVEEWLQWQLLSGSSLWTRVTTSRMFFRISSWGCWPRIH